jgi:hypothetical protein
LAGSATRIRSMKERTSGVNQLVEVELKLKA